MATLTAYAAVTDLFTYCDWREVGEVIVDANEVVSAVDLANPNNIYGARLVQILNGAAGDIETALMVSGMYTTAQLAALTGNSQQRLIKINCQIAIYELFSRKPLYNADKLAAYKKISEDILEKLRKGENVFNIQANVDAGTPEASGLSTVEESNSGLTAYNPSMHYFPVPRQIFGNG